MEATWTRKLAQHHFLHILLGTHKANPDLRGVTKDRHISPESQSGAGDV